MASKETEVLFYVECAKRELLTASALIEEECGDDKGVKRIDLDSINALVIKANKLLRKAIYEQNIIRMSQPPILTLVVN